jgi:spectinomycin phosphotransferase
MLEKPDLRDEDLITCLQNKYDLQVNDVTFLPFGIDVDAAVYRATQTNSTVYFVKLRRGVFNEVTVKLPAFFSERGIRQIIAPLATTTNQLWANLGAYKLVLFPFINAKDGYHLKLTERNWLDFGQAMKSIHTMVVPPELRSCIQQETYSPHWRKMTKSLLKQVEGDTFTNPVAAEMAAFLRQKSNDITDLIRRAEHLALALQSKPGNFVVCHSDLHAGNVLVSDRHDFYIVDWDNPILAPKERDLMYIGGGQGFIGYSVLEEETLFYKGYGQTRIDPVALAYYRYERIIEDIAAFCQQIIANDRGAKDQKQALFYLKSNFVANGTLQMAYQSDKTI